MRIKPNRQSIATNRQPEKWFRRMLWIVAIIFAGFLIGLGGKIVADLPLVATSEKTVADYVENRPHYDQLQNELKNHEKSQTQIQNDWEQKNLALQEQHNEITNAQSSFNNWLATRSVTEQSEQNPEVIKRTQAIDALKAKERVLEQEKHVIEQRQLDVEQNIQKLQSNIDTLEEAAYKVKEKDDKRIELQVFLYRLLITLPLLILAWYLFAKYRQSAFWPFVWGFIFFALFVFFVELVPYLPNYGGYVRYMVGIIVTIFVGRYAIIAMEKYLARKKAEEALSINERQSQMNYDQAQAKIAKDICPSCERKLDFKNPELDFCPHCGIHLFTYCENCNTRKSAFNRYCCKCGTVCTDIKDKQ